MKRKLLTLTWLFAIGAAALAQTTTVTVNNSTGLVNTGGVTPNFAAVKVNGITLTMPPSGNLVGTTDTQTLTQKAIALTGSSGNAITITMPDAGAVAQDLRSGIMAVEMATPQRYGAFADGTSHPVSEWLTGGAHPRGYANLAAIQAVYPHVISLSDEIDWAATQQALHLNKTVFVPSVASGYKINRPLITQDDGQQIIGGGRQGPYGTSAGAVLLAGPGIDAIRCEYHAASVRDLTISGSTVAIHSISGNPAVMTTSTAHGLLTAPLVAGAWTITGNTVASPTVIATSVAHGLSHGDLVKISGSSGGVIDGIHRVVACDASGATVASVPWSTATHFKILDASGNELSAGSNGGACSLVRAYEVMVGPYRNSAAVVTGGTSEVIGLFVAVPLTSTTLTLYKRDWTGVDMTVASTNDTGVLYTTRTGLFMGDGSSHDNQLNSPDPGHSYALRNLRVTKVATGYYNIGSDASGGEALTAQEIGVGLWCLGNLDNGGYTHCWMTDASVAAYKVSRNGGLSLYGSGAANVPKCLDMSDDNGNRGLISGAYFEAAQQNSDIFIDGGDNSVSGNNHITVDGCTFVNQYFTGYHFRTGLGGTTKVTNCIGSNLRGLQLGSSQIFGDGPISNVVVNGSHLASDALYVSWDAAFPALTSTVTGGGTTNTSPSITFSSSTAIAPGMSISGSNIAGGSRILSVEDNTHATLDRNATGSGSGITFTLFNYAAGQIMHVTQNGGMVGGPEGVYRSAVIGGVLSWRQIEPSESFSWHNFSGDSTFTLTGLSARHWFNSGVSGSTGSGVVVTLDTSFRNVGDRVQIAFYLTAADASKIHVINPNTSVDLLNYTNDGATHNVMLEFGYDGSNWYLINYSVSGLHLP